MTAVEENKVHRIREIYLQKQLGVVDHHVTEEGDVYQSHVSGEIPEESVSFAVDDAELRRRDARPNERLDDRQYSLLTKREQQPRDAHADELKNVGRRIDHRRDWRFAGKLRFHPQPNRVDEDPRVQRAHGQSIDEPVIGELEDFNVVEGERTEA